MKGTEARKLIASDPDFVYLKRANFSLKELVEKHPDGVPDRVIAAALMITEEDVEDMYQNIVLKLRKLMKVDLL